MCCSSTLCPFSGYFVLWYGMCSVYLYLPAFRISIESVAKFPYRFFCEFVLVEDVYTVIITKKH
jgi:hypothetical protein